MSDICPPENYRAVSVSVERSAPGNYRVQEHHAHDGARSWCPDSSTYQNLTWEEALDVMGACMDSRRPGMHPEGWEQRTLF